MSGLIGLMINNLHLLRRNILFYIMIWLVPFAIQLLSYFGMVNSAMNFSPILFLLTLATFPSVSLEVVGHALNAKWDVFQKAMPVRKELIIASHYLTFILLSGLTLVLWLLLPFEHHGTANLILTMVLVQLICIAYYPISYLLYTIFPQRESTGQIILIASFAIAFAGGSVFGNHAPYDYLLPVSIILTVGLYVISFALSVFFDGLSRKGRKRRAVVAVS
ncbi:MAG: ABC-2 transporter permease [Defluviitaleaceae bacterium]|nr:ABC-2 transporter permease [Defluviitaleaceae bacterium]MCL2238513.1 ABC-2 transporter permease [Defluviitaleaceae bacterium]